MQVSEVLLAKVRGMAAEAGGPETLDGLDHHYYEREIVGRVLAREEVSITEVVEAVTWLREFLNSQEALK